MLVAHRARTAIVLAAAGATVIAALLARQGESAHRGTYCELPIAQSSILQADFTTSRIAAGAHDENVVVTITAPTAVTVTRPLLSVAIVIDRSGSMAGAPIENAKAAASRLVGALRPDDAFSVITYSTGRQIVMSMSRASDANKTAARDAIARIYDDGGTCISCGIAAADEQLATTTIEQGVRRIVLISDGQANEGIRDRDELAHFTADLAAHGTSLTAVGVGLDFDELTMQRLAAVGHGNYYFVENTQHLSAMFAKELDGLSQIAITDARLTIDDPRGEVLEAYGYQIDRVGSVATISVSDLGVGETRKVVLRVHLPRVASTTTFGVALGYRDMLTAQVGEAHATAVATLASSAHEVEASVLPYAAQAVEEALSARALEEAANAYETKGYAAAREVLDQRMTTLQGNAALPAPARAKLEAASRSAAEGFKNAAPAATKASRAAAYDLAR